MTSQTASHQRLKLFRDVLKNHKLDAYVIPSEDEHHSEYIDNSDARREYLSGFDGSAGLAVVTLDSAYLFTDGRYFLQASNQLTEDWTLMKMGEPNVPTWQDFVCKDIGDKKRIGFDPKHITIEDAKTLESKSTLNEIVYTDSNLVDEVWCKNNMPKRTQNPIKVLDTKYAGVSYEEKINKVKQYLNQNNAYAIVISQLDEIAWLFNLRGTDIPFNPVFFSYSVVTLHETYLFVKSEQIKEVQVKLKDITIKDYDQVYETLKSIDKTKTVIMSPVVSMKLKQNCLAKIEIKQAYITYLKSVKNEQEVKGAIDCHIKDAIALCKYFSWLEKNLKNNAQISEVDGLQKLLEFRKQQEGFVSESFDTISSTGKNGAIIHYKPTKESCEIINKEELYLCDSGGQYLNGTTDVTRTWLFSNNKPKENEKTAYTKVLQGMIDLSLLKFPHGTTGYKMDIIARKSLWENGLDYMHGTGHGVGSFLNVHEGPHMISFRPSANDVPLEPNMLVTNEPGYYEDGQFGIRIENIMYVKESNFNKTFNNKKFYEFETITLVPLDHKLIDKNMLTITQLNYINDYHQNVLKKLSPYLTDDNETLQWLKRYTQNI